MILFLTFEVPLLSYYELNYGNCFSDRVWHINYQSFNHFFFCQLGCSQAFITEDVCREGTKTSTKRKASGNKGTHLRTWISTSGKIVYEVFAMTYDGCPINEVVRTVILHNAGQGLNLTRSSHSAIEADSWLFFCAGEGNVARLDVDYVIFQELRAQVQYPLGPLAHDRTIFNVLLSGK